MPDFTTPSEMSKNMSENEQEVDEN